MLIEIAILFINGHVEIFKDEIKNEDELSLFEKIFSDSIVRIKTHFNQHIYFRPSQVLSISIKYIEKNNNIKNKENNIIKKSKEVKKNKEIIQIPVENDKEEHLLSVEDDIITDIE